MEITPNGDFKVGNTTLKSPIMIRILDYGWDLPEIHSSSPIGIPTYTSVANIINWLERGIDVEFCNKKIDMERVFFFLLEYNRFAEEENKKIDAIENHYRIASNAQARLYRTLDYNNFIEKRKADEKIPFKKNLTKKIKQKKNSIVSSYRNPYMEKQNQKGQRTSDESNPTESYAYDVFAPLHDSIQPEISSFKDVELEL
jgi:hypothetical protein